MKVLERVKPTAEQLEIFSRNRLGPEIIRGAAGSGKTTTAILKLQANIAFFLSRRRRQSNEDPVQVLALTFNRTLRGYIEKLVRSQAAASERILITVDTFGRWSRSLLGSPSLLDDSAANAQKRALARPLALGDYAIEEIDYVMGRFLPADLNQYVTASRHGRGIKPRVDAALRTRLLAEVIGPYTDWKDDEGYIDWNDLAISLVNAKLGNYDIVVVDEAQDFSANQVRAILNQCAPEHMVTFVLDSAQRIYPRGFVWSEVGITLRPENSHRLQRNYRNTKQIAAFSRSILDGLQIDDDYTLPDFARCDKEGDKPIIVVGKYSKQVSYAIHYIAKKVDLARDSVVFLHPKGGQWFSELRTSLKSARLAYVDIQKERDWPDGDENIALCTLHSSKGLEFDHVVILGLNAEVIPDGEIDQGDDRNTAARKLLAVGASRARKTLIIGYKAGEGSSLVSNIDTTTYERLVL